MDEREGIHFIKMANAKAKIMTGTHLHIDLGASFKKLVVSSFTRYNGCLIEHNGSCFIALGKQVATFEDAKRRIDGAIERLGKNILNAGRTND